MSPWVTDVLGFWFRELSAADWFRKDDGIDAGIRLRFTSILELVSSQSAQDLAPDAKSALAAVIALDQFPRNMFRGRASAFEHDGLARSVVRTALQAGFDRELDKDGRLFLYLPFEHSESPEDQALSVKLIDALGDPELTRYAEAHKAIIDRFGRFPHRNAVLGWVSTAAELSFLEKPGCSFQAAFPGVSPVI